MFEFDFGLGDELDLLRDTVREFASDRIAPRADAIDELQYCAAKGAVRAFTTALVELPSVAVTSTSSRSPLARSTR